MPEPIRIDYDAPPTVSRFLDSDAFVRAIVGPIGSGKSSGCVLEILRRAREQAPGPDGIRHTRFAIVRNTYRELKDTTRKTFEQWIPAPLGRWHEQEFIFEMRFGDVHSEVLFRALDRPEDVKKLLSLELTGCYFNELREIAKPVFDGMQGRVGRYPAKKDGGASWFGVWADSNPWPTGHWCHKLLVKERPEEFALFEQPDGLGPGAENVDNLPAGYYARLTAGKDKEWIDCYARGKYPSSDVGSIYGALLEALRQRGGVCDFDGPTDEVFTTWDLGGAGARGDATAVWFWRLNAQRVPDVLGCYENHGLPLSHYFDVLDQRAKERGYQYAKHWLPHDARQSPLVTGMSVYEMFCGKFGAGSVALVPQMSLADGLQAGRWLLEQDIRIHATECAAGLEALGAYRYAWDEANKVFSNKPVHDWSSHCSDAWRYLAVVAKATDTLTRKPTPKPDPVAKPHHYSFTMDQLWEANKRRPGRERL